MIYLVLFLGFALRLIGINQSLWLDEATSALVARMEIVDIFGKFIPGDFHPPLYYLILKYWSLFFGESEPVLRILSVITGMIAVFLVYKTWGKIPGILLATAPLHVYYSQEARMYSLASLLVVTAFVSFVKINQDDSRVGNWVFFALSLSLIGATDYVALLIIPVFWLWGILYKKSFSWFKKLFMSHIILIGFFILWLPYFGKQLASGLSVSSLSPTWWNVLGSLSVKNIFLIPVKFAIGRIGFESNTVYFLIAAPTIMLFGYLILLAFKKLKAGLLIWLWLLLPILFGIVVSFKVSILSYFRLLFVLPAFYILISQGIENTKKHQRLILTTAIFLNIIFSSMYLFNPKFHRENWRDAVKTIGEATVVFPSSSQQEAFKFYGKTQQIKSVTELGPNDRTIWFSRYVWEISDPHDLTRIQIETMGYNKFSEYNFNGVVFWKYIK